MSELDATGSRGFAVGAGDWPLRGFIVKTLKGVAAYVNYCPHAGHPLNFRPDKFLTPDQHLILCCSHGALFTKDEGACIAGPCVGQSLTPIPIEIVSGFVMIGAEVDVEKLANEPL
jgi:nitrite reductase/ring-hydroxylating ferredoxin subunit